MASELRPTIERRDTAKSTQAAMEAKEYQYYNKELVEAIGYENIYRQDERPAWEIDDLERPYLKHVKSCSSKWHHLRQLADWMQVSTTSLRWKHLKEGGKWAKSDDPNGRDKRAERTNVTRLDFLASGASEKRTFVTSKDLERALKAQTEEAKKGNTLGANQASGSNHHPQATKPARTLRLFIVEDLSRDVIEHLGAHYDIEPTFFRDHIFDYVWYNVRDGWFDPPRLHVTTKQQRWLQIRYATLRYFESAEDFVQGCDEFESFNVYRRLEDDLNNRGNWDAEGAIVGAARNRATFWLDLKNEDEGPIGVILIDPTIKSKGHPLWTGYRNWEQTPSMRSGDMPSQVGPKGESFYQDLVYWLEKPNAFLSKTVLKKEDPPIADMHRPVQALLYMICSQWLMIGQYLNTRLSQVEWETAFPEHFLIPGDNIDRSLKKLHIWRRLLPTYLGMITETLEQVFDFQSHATSTTGWPPNQNANAPSSASRTGTVFCQRHGCTQDPLYFVHSSISDLQEDFLKVRASMTEYRSRIDRLTGFVTSMISINDSHRGLDESRNVFVLTLLATCFIPLSLLASIFSMTSDLQAIGKTAKMYVWVGLLFVSVTGGLSWALTSKQVQYTRLSMRAKYGKKKKKA